MTNIFHGADTLILQRDFQYLTRLIIMIVVVCSLSALHSPWRSTAYCWRSLTHCPIRFRALIFFHLVLRLICFWRLRGGNIEKHVYLSVPLRGGFSKLHRAVGFRSPLFLFSRYLKANQPFRSSIAYIRSILNSNVFSVRAYTVQQCHHCTTVGVPCISSLGEKRSKVHIQFQQEVHLY